jgi:hypothetical protein
MRFRRQGRDRSGTIRLRKEILCRQQCAGRRHVAKLAHGLGDAVPYGKVGGDARRPKCVAAYRLGNTELPPRIRGSFATRRAGYRYRDMSPKAQLRASSPNVPMRPMRPAILPQFRHLYDYL